MIRIVTEFVQTPSILLLCDHPYCGVFAQFAFDHVPAQEELTSALPSFIAGRKIEGWHPGMDRQLCPGHNPSKSALALPQQISLARH